MFCTDFIVEVGAVVTTVRFFFKEIAQMEKNNVFAGRQHFDFLVTEAAVLCLTVQSKAVQALKTTQADQVQRLQAKHQHELDILEDMR